MDDRKRFFDVNAPAWDNKFAQDVSPERLEQVIGWFMVNSNDAVLDVGTGTGVLLPLLGRAVGPRGMLAAMDFSFNMLKMALSRMYDLPPSLINAGVGAIPFRNGSFDGVTCFSAFPHFPDKQRALAEMVRVLKPSGTVSIAHLHSIEEIAQLHMTVGDAVKHDHLPDRETMLGLMENAGLSQIHIVNEPGKFLAQGRKG